MGLSGPAEALLEPWLAAWEPALAAWSRFTKLSPPRLCVTKDDEAREGLTQSFAMIRLNDHAVVVSLRQVAELGLGGFAREILAHEIGHHVFTPGDLRDKARLLARVRRALPTREGMAGFVANLYEDLLINDRLERAAELDMAGVFARLRTPGGSRLWVLYLTIYERLWRLSHGTLVEAAGDERLRSDADLGARVIRAYAKDWLAGAGRFAALLLPYLLEQESGGASRVTQWLDTQSAGAGELIPDGLAEIDDDEEGGALHPAEDPALTGLRPPPREGGEPGKGGSPETVGGGKNRYRDPTSFVELMNGLGVRVSVQELIVRYYRERARPHLVPFPARLARKAAEPQPEGLDPWDIGSPLADIDWVGSLALSPVVVPGLTTLERSYGATDGGEPEKTPLDLYVGIDCSGSMSNPAAKLSYPVLAGTILALSALRARARVMACLSGEPGSYSETKGFVRDERELLGIMTGYLGTGYAFGVERLRATFVDAPPLPRPAHILVVSDSDFFYMLKQVKGGWELAQAAALRAGGGATAVLELPRGSSAEDVARLTSLGWAVHCVTDMSEVVAFAAAFARTKYAEKGEGAR